MQISPESLYKTALADAEISAIMAARTQYLQRKADEYKVRSCTHTKDFAWRLQRVQCMKWPALQQQEQHALEISSLLVYPPDVIELLLPTRARLSDDQLVLAVSIILGMNVFVTGSAGTGKSVGLLVAVHTLGLVERRQLIITSTTGVSACNINGTTIDSAMLLHVNECDDWTRGLVRREYGKLALLVIDEASMLRPKDLYEVDMRMRVVAKETKAEHLNQAFPFGGLQIVGSGDFFQLPPVYKTNKDVRLQATEQQRWTQFINQCGLRDIEELLCAATYIFEVPLFWQTFHRVVFLRRVLRQQDEQFVTLLERLRFNLLTEGDLRHLQLRCVRQESQVPEDVMRLCPKNQDVDDINNARMNAISLPEVVFSMIQQQGYTGGKNSTAADGYVGPLDRASEQHVRLKAGCSVRITRNFPQTANGPGFVNGARGTLLGFVQVCCIQKATKVSLRNGGMATVADKPCRATQNGQPAMHQAAAAQDVVKLFGPSWHRRLDARMLTNSEVAPALCELHTGSILLQFTRNELQNTFSEHPFKAQPAQSALKYRQKPDDALRARNFNYTENPLSAMRYYVCVVQIEDGPARGQVAVVPPCIWSAFIYRKQRQYPAVSQCAMPLKLAWASTIHRSQGLSVDKAVVRAPYFERYSGLLYTAATRVRTIDGLTFTDTTAFHLNQPDNKVYALYTHCFVE